MSGQLLDGKRETVFMMDPADLKIIGIDTSDGPDHQLWDERIKLPLDEGMVLNIMALGVRQSISVVVQGAGENKIALVVDGRQRVRHAREANKRLAAQGEPIVRVPVMAEKGMEEKLQDMLAVSLNAIRQDDPVMVKAAKAGRMKARGHTFQEIAVAFGVEAQTVGLWININSLSTSVKEAINEGRITPTAAGALASLTPEQQKEALDNLLAESAANGGKAPTVNNVKNHVKSKTKKTEVTPVPARRALRRVIEHGEELLGEDFINGIRFALGDLNPKTVKGLTSLMAKPKKEAPKRLAKN